MKRVFYSLLAFVAIFVAVSLWWRGASRRRRLPCPSWLAWLVSNPFSDVWATTEVTLDHIGLQAGEQGLDVGSGPGRLAIPAARRVGPEGSIIAFDLQAGMLDRLRQRAAWPARPTSPCGSATSRRTKGCLRIPWTVPGW